MTRDVPSGWRRMTLGEVAMWGSGGTPKRTNPSYFGGSIPWVVIGDLNDNVVSDSFMHITDEGLRASAAKWIPPGAVLLAMYGSIGKLGIAGEPLTTNQAIAHAIVRDQLVDAKYLFWYLRAIRNDLRTAGKGGTQQNISQTVIKALPIPVPPVDVQRRLVDMLEVQMSRLDAAIESLRVALRKLQRYRVLSLQVAVNRGEAAGHFSALGEIAEIQGGIQKQPKRAPRANHYPFLRVANVLRGRLALRDVHRVELFGDELDRLRLRRGDLLIVEGNGSPSQIGRMAVWDGSIADCVHQNHLIRARLGPGVIPAWAQIVWNSPAGQEAVRTVASSTSGLYTLSVSKVGRITIPVPSLADQKTLIGEADRALSVSEQMEADVVANLRRADSLKRAILTEAFRGTLGAPA